MNSNPTELFFRNFNNLDVEATLQTQWDLHKDKFVDDGEHLVFFYLPNDDLEQRSRLRAFLSHYRNEEEEDNRQSSQYHHARIAVVGDKPSVFFNFYGWEEDISFCFSLEDVGRSMRQLVKRLRCYPYNKNAPIEKLKIKSKGKFDLEPIQDICYCLADGNFTEIHLGNGKRRVESKAISFINDRLQKVASMGRIGRSYIINRNRVFRVDSKEHKVYFTANRNCPSRVLTFGDTYMKRIREFVYWY
ncbi:LytTR family transcriptional regulator DNA-binding domain-containing protein [Flagellimonas myxillae]|uniref:LytTR family transcriptional regulator DNA-binding domain-containing protein n=1 Tax=Flagellimonas myxillae TaxID=2942214 RepID=UPI00201F196E|nr:LytTR family transcriptional regulator DNA-binding domain-containing protein [Muricauda myxillae]MCL6265069.1 LytTR family transcriptional regulator DNA-binding domain-containing protein [Muricauda myxillae]